MLRTGVLGITKGIGNHARGGLIVLTVFATPKPFRGHIGVIQRNAIRSWIELQPACEIILLGDDEGTAEVARELKVRHIPDVDRNEHGTPLVSSVFAAAEAAASYPRLCYVNADIILMSDFLLAVQAVCKEKGDSVMVGRRWDVHIRENLDFTVGWEQRLRARIRHHGRQQIPSAMDYFVFTPGLWGEIPPFALGRSRWDNWLVYRARSHNLPIVDLTKCVTAVHQNHDYAHHPEGVGMWESEEAKRNLELAGGPAHLYTLLDAQYCLTKRGVRRRVPLYGIYRNLVCWSETYRALRLILKLIRAIREAGAWREYLFRPRILLLTLLLAVV